MCLQMKQTEIMHTLINSITGQEKGEFSLFASFTQTILCIVSCVLLERIKNISLCRFESALSDVEDSGSALKDGRGVWGQFGPHQMFLFLWQGTVLGAGGAVGWSSLYIR